KRKLLWANKAKNEAEEAAKWSGTRFAQDNDGKQNAAEEASKWSGTRFALDNDGKQNAAEEAAKWRGTRFAQDNDGKQNAAEEAAKWRGTRFAQDNDGKQNAAEEAAKWRGTRFAQDNDGKQNAAEEAAKWRGTRFAQDNDGKQVSMFMRLMGIKEPGEYGIKSEFCELELPRRELPTHEGYCGVRTEQCPECKEYVMIKYQQLHVDSNHGFIRLDDGTSQGTDCYLILEVLWGQLH
ncbi:TRAF-type zinc finger domain containing 1, partial [Operophtera brumata]